MTPDNPSFKYPQFDEMKSEVRPSVLLTMSLALGHNSLIIVGEFDSQEMVKLKFIAEQNDPIQLIRIKVDGGNEIYENMGTWEKLDSRPSFDLEKHTHVWTLLGEPDTRRFLQSTVVRLVSPDKNHREFRVYIKAE